MKTRNSLIILILAISLPWASIVRAEETAPPQLERNAALIYWVAFDQYDALVRDEAVAKAVNEYGKTEIDAKLRKALRESPVLPLLHLASGIDRCDWGTAYMLHEQGPMTLLPHLARCRQLARLGLLSARVHLQAGKPDKALDDLMAVYRLSRHSQSGDILISLLVGVATEAMANQFVADHLGAMDEATLKALLERHAKLPAMMHVSVAIRGERDGFGAWIKRELLKLKDKAGVQQLLATMADGEQAGLLRQVAGLSLEAAVALADDMIRMYDPLVEAMKLPPDEFKQSLEDWTRKVEASKNPLVKMLMPAFGTSYYTYHRSLAQSAILRAAITLKLEDRAAFDKLKDPYGDGPFTVEETDEGLVISSKLPDRDQKPVKLTVKWRPAKP